MKSKWGDEQITDYLINHIKQSIINDVGGAFFGWSSQMQNNGVISGFFAVPRMLFPEIDGLGSYITGNPKSTSLNIKTYFSEVLSNINSKYATYASFIVFIYRHGLLHQHDPKRFKYRNKEIGWEFRISNPNNPIDVNRKHHLEFKSNLLIIDANVFYDDVINSLDSFADDVINKYRKSFEISRKMQIKPLTKSLLLRSTRKNKKNQNRYIWESDFNFLENI